MNKILSKFTLKNLSIDNSPLLKGFAMVGLVWALSKAIRFSYKITKYILPQPDLKEKYYSNDSYVLVTGATDGIGKGFCQKFASLGFNIIMVVRNLKKATLLGEELKLKYKVQCKIVLSDFKLYIAVLVNNVGVHENPFLLEFRSPQEISQHINTNTLSQTILTTLITPKMMKRAKKSAIIDLASFAAEANLGICEFYLFLQFNENFLKFHIYSASKTFNDYFSRGIAVNMREKIDVISLRPLYVSTPMTNHIKKNGSISVDYFVECALKRLGKFTYHNGALSHEFQSFVIQLLPEKTFKNKINTLLKREAQKELRKQEKQKPKQLIGYKRPLHWVFKIGDRKQSLNFFVNILGMKVLRHEEFSEGSDRLCNVQYDGKYSKTIVGYGSEDDHFVFELRYNYTVKKYQVGDDYRYIQICQTGIVDKVKDQNYNTESELTENGVKKLYIRSPDGYLFQLCDSPSYQKDYVTKLSLSSTNIYYTKYFWVDILKNKLISFDHNQLSFKSEDASQFQIEFIQQRKINNCNAFGRVSFSCENPLEVQNLIQSIGTGSIHTHFVKLDTQGKSQVEMVILQDTDHHEICFFGDKGFRELSQYDTDAYKLLQQSIQEDNS